MLFSIFLFSTKKYLFSVKQWFESVKNRFSFQFYFLFWLAKNKYHSRPFKFGQHLFDQTPPTLKIEKFKALPFGPSLTNSTPFCKCGGVKLLLPLAVYYFMVPFYEWGSTASSLHSFLKFNDYEAKIQKRKKHFFPSKIPVHP